MVEKLVHRLNAQPDDLVGWLMLGRSYVALQEYRLGVRAYERADRVANGRNAEALVGEAEALTLMDDTELNGQAGQLIEQALAIEPTSPQALFFGAGAALRRGELPLARARFTKLLSLNPPDRIKAILDHEVRQFGIRVVLVEPAYSRTGFDANSVTAATRLDAYAKERSRVAAALAANFQAAPEPRGVAEEIAQAIESPHRLRRPVGSQAKLVGRMRRFMPAGAVDRQLRKVYALE
jgi:tetratricopeptide (TPR) repeat protein